MKEYDNKFYTHKFDNLLDMKQFFERHNLAKLTQEKIGDPNGPVSIKEIESIINHLPKQKASGADGFTSKFYQKSKQEITPILFNVS